jgi:2-keto-4-pentenoate hydratase
MSEQTDVAARRLRDAYAGATLAPLRDVLHPLDASGAYAIQEANTRYWRDQGRRVVGRKAGLTAEAVQKQLGVDQPDYGVLFADMRIANGGVLDPARTIQPKAEAEIAFVLNRALPSPKVELEDVRAAIRSVHAAIEIVDSRIADWKITFADTVADNGSSAFFALSDHGLPLAGLDLAGAAMEMTVNGAIASQGIGAAVLGNPLNAATWLARTVAERGDPLQAGDILLAGALGPMVTLAPGDRVAARIAGIGACSFCFGVPA